MLLAGPASRGLAQPTVTEDDLRRCTEIADDSNRLACFDWITRAMTAAAPASALPATASAPEPPAAAPSAAAVATFGSELVPDTPGEALDEIQSRFAGEFTGWNGNTIFTLENGQVWQQSESGRLVLQADSPLVTIRRGAFSTYRLSVEGVNRAVRVRRIR